MRNCKECDQLYSYYPEDGFTYPWSSDPNLCGNCQDDAEIIEQGWVESCTDCGRDLGLGNVRDWRLHGVEHRAAFICDRCLDAKRKCRICDRIRFTEQFKAGRNDLLVCVVCINEGIDETGLHREELDRWLECGVTNFTEIVVWISAGFTEPHAEWMGRCDGREDAESLAILRKGGWDPEMAFSVIHYLEPDQARAAAKHSNLAEEIERSLRRGDIPIDILLQAVGNATLRAKLDEAAVLLQAGMSVSDAARVIHLEHSIEGIAALARQGIGISQLEELAEIDEYLEKFELEGLSPMLAAGLTPLQAYRAYEEDLSDDEIALIATGLEVTEENVARWSGLSADEILAAIDGGFESSVSFRSGLLDDDLEVWRSIDLRLLVRHHPTGTWSAADRLLAVEAARVLGEDAVATMIDAGCHPTKLSAWIKTKVPNPVMVEFITLGFSATIAAKWHKSGVSPSDAREFERQGVELAEARLWRENDFSVAEAVRLRGLGLSPVAAARRKAAGVKL